MVVLTLGGCTCSEFEADELLYQVLDSYAEAQG
jgi:hypothetical protein